MSIWNAFEGGAYNAATLAIAVLALLVAAAGAWYAWRQLLPKKRQLTFAIQPPVPLLSTMSPLADVSVHVDDREVIEPHSLTVEVTNSGRHDISKAEFQDAEPIKLDVGAKILKILDIAIIPARGTPTPCDCTESVLRIGPGLISRGQCIRAQLLTDGIPHKKLSTNSISSDLIDVDVEVKSARERQASTRRAVRAIAITSLISSLAFALILGIQAWRNNDESIRLSPDHGPVGSTLTISGKDYEPYAVISAYIYNSVTYDEKPLGRAQADSNGTFSIKCTVPPIGLGYIEIRVSGAGSGYTSYEYADFAVTS
ncbi:hypothetical protein ACWCOV_12425 [Kribbella sp. NPDC002412]